MSKPGTRGRTGLPRASSCRCVRRKAPRAEARTARFRRSLGRDRRTPIKVRKGPPLGGQLNAAIVPDQLRKLLQARHNDERAAGLARAPARDRVRGRRRSIRSPMAVLRRAGRKPMLTGGSQFGKVQVEAGSLQGTGTRRLIASTHPLVEVEMDYGDRACDDAGDMFPDHPYARKSQYFGMVDIDEGREDPVCLKGLRRPRDGSRHCVCPPLLPSAVAPYSNSRCPLSSRALFIDVARAFASACRAENIRLGCGRLRQHCRTAYRLFKQFAPGSFESPRARRDRSSSPHNRPTPLTPRLRQLLQGIATKPQYLRSALPAGGGCAQFSADRLRDLIGSLTNQIYPHWKPILWARIHSRWMTTAAKRRSSKKGNLSRRSTPSPVPARPHTSSTCAATGLAPDALIEIADTLATQYRAGTRLHRRG